MKFEELFKFSLTAGKLKTIKRKGWVRHKIKEPESVADHSFRTTLLSCVLAEDFKLKREKVIIMSLIHDLAESKVGDLTPFDGVSKEKKHELEMKAISSIFEKFDSENEYVDIFKEYEDGKTDEAKFVRSIDKLEMMLQTAEYEEDQGIDLKEFWDFADNYEFDILKDFYILLKDRRNGKK